VRIEAENVGGFAFELGIVAGHVVFEAVRLEARLLPNPMHNVFTDAQPGRQFAQLQCVDPSLGFLRVADRMRARRAGVSTLGFWPG